MSDKQTYTLPPEWHRQAFAQLTWPDETTDWRDVLPWAQQCFVDMARAIACREPLVIVAQSPEQVLGQLQAAHLQPETLDNIHLLACPLNDTWARDHAFLTTVDEAGHVRMSDFRFNGWGNKFDADKDNAINHTVFPQLSNLYQTLYGITTSYHAALDFVLEGGSIEVDGQGTLLTTRHCLLTPTRNTQMNEADIINRLKQEFGVEKVLMLNHGQLEGDDTDGHIDTLARFCPDNTIAYVACSDATDSHYLELKAMEAELRSFTNALGQPYTLVPLPMPSEIRDDEGERLPATYANFSVVNGAVLLPVYGQEENDREAVSQMRKAFPHHEIVPIDCRVLIRQHGSLHCSTMQYPM